MGLPLSYTEILSVADPGFPRELLQPHGVLTYCLAKLYRKLHKNEKDWNTEGASVPRPLLDPPMLLLLYRRWWAGRLESG